MPRNRIMSLLLLISIFLSCLADDASARRRPRNVFEQFDEFVDVDASIAIPFTTDEAGLIQYLSIDWFPDEYLGLGIGYAHAISPDGISFPGALTLGAVSGTGTTMRVRAGFGAFLNIPVRVSFGFSRADDDDELRAAAMGRDVGVDWSFFKPASAVLSADVVAGLFLSQTIFTARFGPRYALPLYNSESDAEIALKYSAGMGFGLVGDYRGGIGMSFSLAGLKELTGEENHLVAMGFNIQVWLGSLGLIPSFSVSTPFIGARGGIKVTIFFGLSWELDVRPQIEDKRDPVPSTVAMPFGPGFW